MFKIGNDTFTESGYLVELISEETELTIKLTELDSINSTFTHTFKLYGTYPGQTNDLVDDVIWMYENKNKE